MFVFDDLECHDLDLEGQRADEYEQFLISEEEAWEDTHWVVVLEIA